jgi:hypothetical protein
VRGGRAWRFRDFLSTRQHRPSNPRGVPICLTRRRRTAARIPTGP